MLIFQPEDALSHADVLNRLLCQLPKTAPASTLERGETTAMEVYMRHGEERSQDDVLQDIIPKAGKTPPPT